MVPLKQGKIYVFNLSDNVKFLDLFTSSVFRGSWEALWEKSIKYLQYNTELYAP
jgi:hypothetical protein